MEAERPNLWVYHPPQFAPLGGPGPRARRAPTWLRKADVAHGPGGAGHRRRPPIVWISTPTQYDARFDLPARLRVYHIVDDYLAYHDSARVASEPVRASANAS